MFDAVQSAYRVNRCSTLDYALVANRRKNPQKRSLMMTHPTPNARGFNNIAQGETLGCFASPLAILGPFFMMMLNIIILILNWKNTSLNYYFNQIHYKISSKRIIYPCYRYQEFLLLKDMWWFEILTPSDFEFSRIVIFKSDRNWERKIIEIMIRLISKKGFFRKFAAQKVLTNLLCSVCTKAFLSIPIFLFKKLQSITNSNLYFKNWVHNMRSSGRRAWHRITTPTKKFVICYLLLQFSWDPSQKPD